MTYELIWKNFIGDKCVLTQHLDEKYETMNEAQEFLKKQFKKVKELNLNPAWVNKNAFEMKYIDDNKVRRVVHKIVKCKDEE